jgi:hypothetical protein
LKRCGGQGDILSGAVGAFLAWTKYYESGAFGDNTIPVSRGGHARHVEVDGCYSDIQKTRI